MKNWKILWSIIVLLVIIVGVLFFALTKSKTVMISTTNVTDFESCAAAGNRVGESYPRQCWTDDGQHFVEKVY